MAKKSRRTRRKTRQQQPAQVSQPASSKAADTSASGAVDLAQEYAYVLTDLRRIASIAAIMFALLFVLAFALR
jgi:ABC-type transport system involved in cytochrome bd biosynthesis fused ATPase/permease subunit